MIDHIIAFKVELDAAGEKALMKQWERLRDVPQVREMAFGKDFSGRSRGFEYCLRMTFDDAEALAAYDAHPTHQSVRDYNRALEAQNICFDIEY